MYESPIEKVVGEIQSQIIKQDDENIMYAVKQAAGYSVDKNELIKALKYDREQYEKGYRDGLNADKWIPVSERLPEDETYVLTTIKVPNRIAHARSGWYKGGFFHNDNGDTWKATDMEVVAWMPLPTPYEPWESEGEG